MLTIAGGIIIAVVLMASFEIVADLIEDRRPLPPAAEPYERDDTCCAADTYRDESPFIRRE